MKKFLLKRKIAVISIVSVVVVAIIAGIAIMVTQTHNATPTDTSSKTIVGKVITNIIPKDRLGSYLTAPATKEWWETIDGFAPAYQLDTIDFASLPTEPTMLGWSASFADSVNTANQLGLNTVYIAFETDKEAETAVNFFIEKSGGNFQAFATKNVVVIIPTWTFSDVDYLVDEFANLENTGDATTDTGSWTINFTEMQKIVMQGQNETKVNMYEEALKDLGVTLTQATTASSWSGESEDGLTWTGNLSDDGLWVISKASIKDLKETLSASETLTLTNGTEVTREELNKMIADKPNSEIQYLIDPQASTVLEYISIQNNKSAEGTINKYDGTYTTPKPIEPTDFSLVNINPNAWVGYMTIGDGARPLIKYDNVEMKVYNTGTKLDITLTKAVWADEL